MKILYGLCLTTLISLFCSLPAFAEDPFIFEHKKPIIVSVYGQPVVFLSEYRDNACHIYCGSLPNANIPGVKVKKYLTIKVFGDDDIGIGCYGKKGIIVRRGSFFSIRSEMH